MTTDMTTDTSFLEEEIAAERQSLGDNLHELEVRARAVTDWRSQFHRRPWVALGLAACGGAVLSELGRIARPPTRQASESARRDRSTTARPRTQTDETWDRIKGALLVAAATEAAGLLREVLPGFHDIFVGSMRGGGPSATRQSLTVEQD
jgi:hypothetical protein